MESLIGTVLATFQKASSIKTGNASHEFELRFSEIQGELFVEVIRKLLELKDAAGASDGLVEAATVTESVSKMMEGGQIIRFITFKNGKAVGDEYYEKKRLAAASVHGERYKAVLSSETPRGPYSAADSVVRIKARVSFVLRINGLRWRADLTAAKMLEGTNSEKGIMPLIGQMFKGKNLSPQNFIKKLEINPDNVDSHRKYGYEMELEYLDDPKRLDSKAVMAAAQHMLQLTDPKFYQNQEFQRKVYFIASFLGLPPGLLKKYENDFGLKKLAPAVRSLTRTEYRSIYPALGYLVTFKAHGTAAFAVIAGGKLFVLAENLTEYDLPASAKRPEMFKTVTIAQCEAMPGAPGTEHGDLLVYDNIIVKGVPTLRSGIEERYKHNAGIAELINAFAISGTAVAKPYCVLSSSDAGDMEKTFREAYALMPERPRDGIIINTPHREWTAADIIFKWKTEHTIDFLAREAKPEWLEALGVAAPKAAPGKPRKKAFFLFVGISSEMYDRINMVRCPGYSELFGTQQNSGSYSPIQFSPPGAPLAYVYFHDEVAGSIDGKVIELLCVGKCEGGDLLEWRFERVREDRAREIKRSYFGNDYRVAVLTWIVSSVDPFPFEELWKPSSSYFATQKLSIYNTQTACMSFVKSRRIQSLRSVDNPRKPPQWVADMAAGKGQDLFRYIEAGVANLLAVERDSAALAELIRRRFDSRRSAARHAQKPMRLFTLHVDLKSPWAELKAGSDRMRVPAVDHIVMNLALDYFTDTLDSLTNLLDLFAAMVRPGGSVAFLVPYGERIHAKLAGVRPGESWDLRQDEAVKYSIRRMYESEELQDVGQKIAVRHPFSDGAYYEEFLVNTEFLTRQMVDLRGFRKEIVVGVDAHISEFESSGGRREAVSAIDREYLGLYAEAVFVRPRGAAK